MCLHTPEPTQDVHSEDGNAGSGGDPSKGLLGSWFPMGEAVTADHNGNQAGDLGNRSCE